MRSPECPAIALGAFARTDTERLTGSLMSTSNFYALSTEFMTPNPGYAWASGTKEFMEAYASACNALCTTLSMDKGRGQEAAEGILASCGDLLIDLPNPHRILAEVSASMFSVVMQAHTTELVQNLADHQTVHMLTLIKFARTASSHLTVILELDKILTELYGSALTVHDPASAN